MTYPKHVVAALLILTITVGGLALADQPPPASVGRNQNASITHVETSPPEKPGLDSTLEARSLEYYKALAEAQAKISESAIKSSESSVENIKDIIFIISAIIALATAIAAFFGVRQYRSLQKLFEKCKQDSQSASAMLDELKRDREVLIKEYRDWRDKAKITEKAQLDFLTARFDFERYYAGNAKEKIDLRPRIITALEKIRQTVPLTGDAARMLSWISATLAYLYADAKKYHTAIELAIESHGNNPDNHSDRAFNVACYASRAYGENPDQSLLVICAKWLKKAIDEDSENLTSAKTDLDFESTRNIDLIKNLLA